MLRRTTAAVAALVLVAAAGAAGAESEPLGYGSYRQYCAVCHGLAADGNGPVKPVLRDPPTDLRTLTLRYGSPLPVAKLIEFIDGREMPTAHGTREMPVWGKRLLGDVPPSAGSEAFKRGLIFSIVEYLETVQIPAE